MRYHQKLSFPLVIRINFSLLNQSISLVVNIDFSNFIAISRDFAGFVDTFNLIKSFTISSS